MRSLLLALFPMLLWAGAAPAASPSSWMLELTLDGRKIEGMPLRWNAGEVHLLGRERAFLFPSEALVA